MTGTSTIASGSHRRFHHTETTSASRAAIWSLWTDPTTWGAWDEGLRSAVLSDVFEVGAAGTLQPLKGPTAAFVVEAVEPSASYRFATSLPGARLVVEREFLAVEGSRTAFRHTVWFEGPMAWFFARLYGKRFRTALPPTMTRLAEMAERQP